MRVLIDFRFLFIVFMAFMGEISLVDFSNVMFSFHILCSVIYLILRNEFLLLTNLSKSCIWLGILAFCNELYFITICSFIIAFQLFYIRLKKFS